MTIKDAIYRELRYGLCGAGGALNGLVSGTRVKLDMRSTPPSDRAESEYPFIIFRRITSPENNQVQYARARIEMEIIGLRSSATKGDDLLEQIRDELIEHFAGKMKTFGKFDASGNADANGGLKLRGLYVDTVEGFDEDLHEKAHIVIFIFSYIRP